MIRSKDKFLSEMVGARSAQVLGAPLSDNLL
jgi:hypothetical protein